MQYPGKAPPPFIEPHRLDPEDAARPRGLQPIDAATLSALHAIGRRPPPRDRLRRVLAMVVALVLHVFIVMVVRYEMQPRLPAGFVPPVDRDDVLEVRFIEPARPAPPGGRRAASATGRRTSAEGPLARGDATRTTPAQGAQARTASRGKHARAAGRSGARTRSFQCRRFHRHAEAAGSRHHDAGGFRGAQAHRRHHDHVAQDHGDLQGNPFRKGLERRATRNALNRACAAPSNPPR